MKGLYKVRRLPYGVSLTSGLFKKRMYTIVAELPRLVVLLDDIFVSGETTEKRNQVLIEVLNRLAKARRRFQGSKGEIFNQSLEFLEYRIPCQGAYSLTAKVEAIHQAPAPISKK